MKNKIFVIIAVFFSMFSFSQKNNLALSKPITEVFFDTTVIDQYRNLENLQDPETTSWMKSQTDYSDAVLNTIPKRNYYLDKRIKFDKIQEYSVSSLKITGNNKYFYLKKYGNEKIEKLYYRTGFNGKEEMLYDPSGFISSYKTSDTTHEFIINFISPSWDGSKVAISLSEKGKEISEIIIMNVENKYIHPEILINTEPAAIGGIKWLEDNTGFFYVYFPVADIKSDQFNKNTQSILHKIGEDPKKLQDVLSRNNNPDLKISEDQYPIMLAYNQYDKYYLGMLADKDAYRETLIINKKDLLLGKKNWKPLYTKEDKVYYMKLKDEDLFYLSGYDTPNYKLCKTSIRYPNFKSPEVLVAEKADEVFKSFVITKDGIYYTTTKNGVEAKLYLYKDGKEISIKLPYVSGDIELQSKGIMFSDLWITCSGWANEQQRFKYDVVSNTFSSENLNPLLAYPEFKDIIVEEVSVMSRDGVEIPLSLIYNKNLKKDGKAPVLIDAYGAFGISRNPFFARSYLLWASEGGVMAIAHVRGGGEKGEKWRLGGYKENKPNSWRDLIDCTEYLVKKNYTSKEKVAIWGASAGGITVGRAMTERPDLFKAVIAEVGVMNVLRDEATPYSNAKEFGTIKNSKEFKGLLEMDAYSHLKKGVKYPATFITAGINDERVIVWQPVKFAAKLLADNSSSNPILLKVDYEGGHGNNVPVGYLYSNISDIFAFAFWQLGHPDYQPKENSKK